MSNTLQTINDIFCNVLDNENIKLTPETTVNDIEDWDSLTHFQLIIAIEKEFDMQFTSSEISGFQNIGEVCESVQKRIDQK